MREQYVDYVDFGKRIQKQRKKAGISQKVLAEAIDCSCGYMSRLENGKAKPTFEFVVALSEKLQVGIDCFLPYTTAGAEIAKVELQEKWEKCSPEVIQLVSLLVDNLQEFEALLRSHTESN